MATRPVRGRDRELSQAAQLLRRATETGGGILLIEGPPGIGKSCLLTEVARLARTQNFEVLHATADQLLQLMPGGPIFAGLRQIPPTLEPVRDDLDVVGYQHVSLMTHFRASLEERLSRAPVLVALDDLQWADAATLLALRTLPAQFATDPVMWVLARCSPRSGPGTDAGVDRLYEFLEETGRACRMELAQLPDEVMTELVGDLLNATPGPKLRALTKEVDGNPLILTELVTGLAEEGAIRVHDGTVEIVTDATTVRAASADTVPVPLPYPLPQRFHALMHRRLDALSPSTRRLLQVAAVLGRSVVPEQVAEMLDQPPATLLPALHEALAAQVLVCTGDTITFRGAVVWQAVLETVPLPVRGALHRQAADTLLRHGGSVISAAVHLIHGARPGDAEAIKLLHRAAAEAVTSAPTTAAELALRGLELSDPADPIRLDLTDTAVEALTRAGPLSTAIELARETLARSLPTPLALTLQHQLSTALLLSGEITDALELVEKILTEPDLPPGLRDRALLNQLAGLTALQDPAAERHARDLLDASGHHPDVRVGALTTLALARSRAGQVEEALQLAREAVNHVTDAPRLAWHLNPRLALAAILIQVREFIEAAEALDTAQEEIATCGTRVLQSIPHLLRAALELARGNLDQVTAEANTGLALAEEYGMPLYTPLGNTLLATVALRRSDLVTASTHVTRLQDALIGEGARAWRIQCLWLSAQIAAAGDDQASTAQAIKEICVEQKALRRLLAEEPAAAAWLTRTALAVEAHEQAEAVSDIAERLAAANPRTPILVAAAAHVRGLRQRDPRALTRAATDHRDPWCGASAAEDLAVLLADTDRDSAVKHLDSAMATYGAIGADRDAARVRRRLRHLGVRRRHWSYANRPTMGWASLTETERTVAELVAQGLTNRQVASQMFLSPHTVGFHLRQIFRKLGIHSRIDLVRQRQQVTPHPASKAGDNQVDVR
ncbi:hypothetical protein TH66_02795 [Carbonactinospora thermoautotrophica]|uniref:HTH luxR-type domain-containing protein n=1 Tax=Carbonactinospora thermoautotrophica TaxID=1469144 RepID=A0A132MSI6_9ACTN|nr:LuxR family transcriptional regulator [Carbonactinospora thermoautotrophica]KWX00848.1 hypothetical protein LI90_1876 [Carbonactinospora thermoautotrophica]KWX04304.1 hypothetical protein TR74_24365 [Carbonactinospora thermoautotrophica]KWX05232.1 hypothetical protein TH66_02795 [Carbonactinospora thermoautotrophica]